MSKLSRWRAALVLLTAITGLVPAAASGAERAFSFDRLGWQELEFYGSKFGISLRARLRLQPVPAALAQEELLPSSHGPGIGPPAGGALAILLGSEVLGRRSDIRLLIDPGTAAALQRVQTESGRKQRIKSLRYGEKGISTVRTRPREGERDLPPERWSDIRPGGDDYPPMPGGSPPVSDPTALFYVIASAGLERPGDVVEVPISSDDQLLLVEARALDLRRVDVDYERTDGATSRRVEGPVTALRLSLDARVLAGGDGEADFELAGLRGDVEMLLDPLTRTPLQLSGKVPYAGSVAIRLRRVVERPAAPAEASTQRPASRSASSRR